jgi:hypothetical protein
MDAEQKEFLERRLLKAAEEQPELNDLNTLLLQFGGDFLVAPRKPDPDISALLHSGFLMRGPVTVKSMEENGCHRNIAAVWKTRTPALVAVATGYSLSGDGLWRQHSWGVLQDGILETTVRRKKYFGILLQGSNADRFSALNLPSE